MRKGSSIAVAILVILIGTGFPFSAHAADYPTRPIEVVVPYPPGGATDNAFLPFKDKAAKLLGQPVLSVYKPGAGGAIGTAYAANAKPDGYTLVIAYEPNLIYLPLTKNVGYALDSFVPVCNITETRVYLLVKEDSPYKTIRDFVDAAKKKKLTYASAGVHTSGHILMELLSKRLDIPFIHVPYAGGAPALTAVLGGHADIGIVAGTLGMVGPGKLRVLALTGDNRFPISPDVSTLAEFGYPTLRTNLIALWAPKGTPKEVINKLHEVFKNVGEQNREQINTVLKGGEQVVNIISPGEVDKAYKETNEFYEKLFGEMGVLRK